MICGWGQSMWKTLPWLISWRSRTHRRQGGTSAPTSESIPHWSDFAAKVAELYPNYKVPKFPKDDTQPGLVRAEVVGSKKLIAMGMQFSPMEKIIRDLKSRGSISC
ncbi:hypothetical protein SETIT_9G036300v2 [Setaria italica]|uniref:Uncharacterized protein n=2 Tax=Setaria TaxID=4554 RepID=A0A368SCY9_SETIT|nr:hypothetical protein SETIT_9G036300v2 [Setaria italica]TKV90528.1 hypothetical protein SEVIR_9G035233v2 [Setaria viridis]